MDASPDRIDQLRRCQIQPGFCAFAGKCYLIHNLEYQSANGGDFPDGSPGGPIFRQTNWDKIEGDSNMQAAKGCAVPGEVATTGQELTQQKIANHELI